MSLRALALDWRIDASAATLLAQLTAMAALYLLAVARGNRNARRARRWPWQRTLWFLAGLAAAAIDLCSGIGTEADSRLSAHMLEHMVLWVIVAPLLAAGAPVRLAFHALPRPGRRRLARCLHSRTVHALTSPSGSVLLFSAVILLTHIPTVYGLALSNESLHEAEHGLYLLTALLVWAPLIGADPAAPPAWSSCTAPLHGRVHAADGAHRALARDRAPPRVRPLPRRARAAGAARPAARGHDHVGRRPARVRDPRTRSPPAATTSSDNQGCG